MKKTNVAAYVCAVVAAVSLCACGTSQKTAGNNVTETTTTTESTETVAQEMQESDVVEVTEESVAKEAKVNGEELTPDEALELLVQGNADYLANDRDAELREDLATNGQHPYAVVITCSDSRAVPEIALGVNFGEIFTIRTAGNVISDFETGSVEYGAEHLGAPLVVVLGHTNCGAVTAAVEEANATEEAEEVNHITDIVNEIAPAVEEAKENGATEETLLQDSIICNINHSISRLRESEVLSELEEEGQIKIIGAIYDIATGEITYLE